MCRYPIALPPKLFPFPIPSWSVTGGLFLLMALGGREVPAYLRDRAWGAGVSWALVFDGRCKQEEAIPSLRSLRREAGQP